MDMSKSVMELDEWKAFSDVISSFWGEVIERTEVGTSIADDMAGNPYVLDALTGKVFFIDFSANPPIGTKVAASFDEFLASIDVQPFQ